MPYIGNPTVDRFVTPRAASVFSGDGSTTAFTLDEAVGTDEDILVSVDGVIQEPSAAPSNNSGNNIFVYYLHRTIGTVTPPLEISGTYKASGIFRTNVQTLSDDITITATENANVTGPLTVASNKTITVNDGGRLVIL